MRKLFFPLIFITSLKIVFSQPDVVKMFPFSDSLVIDAKLVKLSSSLLMLTFIKRDTIYHSITSDNGSNWQLPKVISKIGAFSSYDVLKTHTGRLIIVWASPTKLFKIFSDDDGDNWSVAEQVGGTLFNPKNIILSQTYDNTIWLSFSRIGNLYYIKSTNNGNNWLEVSTFASSNKNTFLSINSINSGKLIAIFQDNTSGNEDIFYMISTNNGTDWSVKVPLVNSNLAEERPKFFRESTGTLWVIYQINKPTPFNEFKQYDIHYLKSTDQGENWISHQFTKYVDDDIILGIEDLNNKPIIIFHTKRFSDSRTNQLGLAIIGITNDNTPPPVIFKFLTSSTSIHSPLSIKVYVHDDNLIDYVKLHIVGGKTFVLYDDGLHNDENPNDFIFGITVYPSDFSFFNSIIAGSIILPVKNNGVLADANKSQYVKIFVKDIDNIYTEKMIVLNFGGGANYDGIGFLFSGGFMLSGYSNNFLWSNGAASASRIIDYQPGIVGSNPNDLKNKIYIVKRIDAPFSTSWQEWIDAVSLGAYFYDGNNDGIFTPVDINQNGIWDPDEDMPDILGDVTYWCVFNDGIPASNRRFIDVPPQGIEIRQTVFASEQSGSLRNVVFIRYSLLNKGTVSNILDSVFFSIWADPDLGNYSDDLVGCDTILRSGYTYNNGIDNLYGNNPPAFFTTLLQGPSIFTGNPYDTAYNYRGKILGVQKFTEHKNLNPSSFMHYLQTMGSLSDPRNRFEARNLMLGLNLAGNVIDPCSWTMGQVLGGVNCAMVNPLYMYSGNPISSVGWINSAAYDQRMLLNVGPFILEQNKPIDIIIAYLVGRGFDHLSSIAISRNLANNALKECFSNFGTVTDINDNSIVLLQKEMEFLKFV